MDNYFEQSVAGKRGFKERLAYGISWAAVVMLGLAALFFAASILVPSGDGAGINWLSVALLVACVAVAFLAYRRKDSIYRDYDYVLWNDEFEISVVYNRRRRKKVATLPIGKVSAWGPLNLMEGRIANLRKRFWCFRPEKAWCLIYPVENGNEAALLELSDEMCAQIRATSGALRRAEVKQ